MSLWDKRAIGAARDAQIDDKDVPYMFSLLNRKLRCIPEFPRDMVINCAYSRFSFPESMSLRDNRIDQDCAR
jgi:hypothetical protein